MLSFMESEKRKYLSRPESHRNYASEWNYFYDKKCREEGTKLHPSMVKDEWDYNWEKFINRGHRDKVEDETRILMRKFGIRSQDVKDFKERQKNASPKSLVEDEPDKNIILETLR